MYKALIVEDEEFERMSLEKIIRKEVHAITKVSAVSNAYDALELCAKEVPDIIFMDINIPGMDGLSLIKEIKFLYKTPLFIIISSYNDFEYAKTAITLEVKDYILKPYKINVLVDTITSLIEGMKKSEFDYQQTSKLVDKVKQMTPLLEEECLYAILSNQNEIELSRKFALLQYQPISSFCILWDMQDGDQNTTNIFCKDLEDIGYRCIQGSINGKTIIYVLYSGHLQDGHMNVIEAIIAQDMPTTTIGIGAIYNQLTQFHQSYKKALQNLQDKKCASNQTTPPSHDNVQDYVQQLLTHFKQEEEDGIKKVVHQFTRTLMDLSIDVMNKRIEEFIQSLAKGVENETNAIMDSKQMITNIMTQEDKRHNVEINLLYMVNQLLKPAKDLQYRNTNVFVKKAIQYIKENYRKPIGLNDVSKALGVTPFYISRLLNQHSHKNFNDLLNEYRIEEAKKLLKTRKSVKEIASLVGYQNQSYFSKIFKEQVRVTPKTYKQMFE